MQSSIQLSSSVFIEDVVLTKSLYSLSGPARISGNMTFGIAGVPTYDISVKDAVVLGNLTFITDVNYHALNHYFSGCEFQGSITFPTLTTPNGLFITFEDCLFRGSSPFTFYNITNVITFTRCQFNAQTISNGLSTANKV